ncbi:MAG: phosphatidylinositol mannoside acyltransferase [Marmoricola sp.]
MTSRPGPAERAARLLTGHATTAGYLAAWRLVRAVPERTSRSAFDRIADRVYAGDGKGVQRLRANLARVVPDAHLEDTVHAGLRSYFRYWCESFRLPSWPMDDLVRRTRIVDERFVRAAAEAGDGIVVPLPHMGNWDWAGAWACSELQPLMTVAERLRPERLYDEFIRYRASLGMHVLPLTGGQPPMGHLESWVGAGGLVCLLGDRDLSRTGVEVDLVGERARVPVGPAVIARRTGAALVPATLHYEGETMVVRFHEPVPHVEGYDGIVTMTQQVTDVFTEAIRDHPQDWHMMQKVFVADLEVRR